MRKKEHSGSAAVIGAQLVILFILTVSLCVQSRKAAAENTYAVMEKSGEGSRAGEPEKAGEAGDSQKKKYIHWVEFNVPADVMEKAFRLDMGTVQEGCILIGWSCWHISGRNMAEILSGSGRRIWTRWWRN